MYQFQEYPKWVNGKVVKSREEELRAECIRKDEGIIYGGGSGGAACETPGQTSEEKSQEISQEENRQEETSYEEKKSVYPEKYLGVIIYEHEVMDGGKWYKCCICRKELKYKQRFAKHKAMHDVHHGLKDIKEVNFGFNKRTEKVNNDVSRVQDVGTELVEKTD